MIKKMVPWYFQKMDRAIMTRTCESIETGILDYMKSHPELNKSTVINTLLARALELDKKTN